MKRMFALLCTCILCLGLTACGEDTENEFSSDESYVESESDVEGQSEEQEVQLADEIEKFDEVYAGSYGDERQIVLAFDWSDEEQNGLVMILPNDSDQMEYFNVGEMTGEMGSLQTISGIAQYPFSFTVTDYTEEGNKIELTFEDGGVCTIEGQEQGYLMDKCKSLGML